MLIRGVVMVLFEPPGGSDPLCAQENNLRVKEKVFVFLNDKGKTNKQKKLARCTHEGFTVMLYFTTGNKVIFVYFR